MSNNTAASVNNIINRIEELNHEIAILENQENEPLGHILHPDDPARIKVDEKRAEGLAQVLSQCPGLSAFGNAIDGFENGIAALGADDTAVSSDVSKVNGYLTQIGQAIDDQLIADTYRSQIEQDSNNNTALSNDFFHIMQEASAEDQALTGLQTELGLNLTTFNTTYLNAQTDKNNFRWYDYLDPFKWDQPNQDSIAMQNCTDMTNIIHNVLSDLASKLASAQNTAYETAALALNRILQTVKKLIVELQLHPENVGKIENQIKYLMALVLGILTMIQSTASQLKAKNQQTESQSTINTVEMNLASQQASFQQLESDLSYANAMKIFMDIAQPLMDVGGMLLAPGVGSFLVMLAFTILDSVQIGGSSLLQKLTTALTNKLKEDGLSSTAATALSNVIVGVAEIALTVGGGMALDTVIKTAIESAMTATEKETSEAVAKQIEEATEKALQKAGTEENKAAVQEMIAQTINGAVKSAVSKTVQLFSKQASATLIPQLLKEACQGRSGLACAIAAAAQESCIAAAEKAATIAGEDIAFIAEGVAEAGISVAPNQIAKTIAERAANEAVASVSGITSDEADSLFTSVKSYLNKPVSATEKVAAKTAAKTAIRTAVERAALVTLYNVLSDGAISAIIKKAEKKGDEKSLLAFMDIVKAVESILASLVVMQGTGVLDSTVMNGASTTLLKAGAIAQIGGTAAQAISLGGQADADSKQAAVNQSINKDSTGTDILQMLLDQINQQGQLDRKHVENQLAEQASNFTMVSQLANNENELAKVLSQQAV